MLKVAVQVNPLHSDLSKVCRDVIDQCVGHLAWQSQGKQLRQTQVVESDAVREMDAWLYAFDREDGLNHEAVSADDLFHPFAVPGNA